MARGIDEDTARRLVVRGFFADLIERIGLPDIEQRLLTAVDEELDRATRQPRSSCSAMATLEIKDLHVSVDDREIFRGSSHRQAG